MSISDACHSNRIRLGIDLGGTKIEIIALDDSGDEAFRYRRKTPQGDYSGTIEVIAQLVEQAKNQFPDRDKNDFSIGIGIPGAISLKTGLVKNANSVCLIGKPFQADLEKSLEQPVRINNDANCLAVSEAIDGAAAGYAVVFAVILGTGVGGGIAINQQILTGVNAIAGEWGHNPMPWNFHVEELKINCYCGQVNCIETFLSGPGLLNRYQQAGGLQKSVADIVLKASEGDLPAEQFMCQYEQWLAKALSGVINILDPDVIVLAGGLSNIERLYQNIPRYWQDTVFSDQVNTQLVQAKYGDSSGVRGAAWLWN